MLRQVKRSRILSSLPKYQKNGGRAVCRFLPMTTYGHSYMLMIWRIFMCSTWKNQSRENYISRSAKQQTNLLAVSLSHATGNSVGIIGTDMAELLKLMGNPFLALNDNRTNSQNYCILPVASQLNICLNSNGDRLVFVLNKRLKDCGCSNPSL